MHSEAQFSIAPSHIDVIQHGEVLTIPDQRIEGVSTRTLRPQLWSQSQTLTRTVDLEYRDDEGAIRRVSVEQPIEMLGDPHFAADDELAQYARRASHGASKNALQELIEHNSVERSGFAVNDQGLMLTASGKMFCCGLFELLAVEVMHEGAILWTEDLQPAAVLRLDDPNSLVISKMLQEIVRLNDDGRTDISEDRFVGTICCGGRISPPLKQVYPIFALCVSIVAGVAASHFIADLINGPAVQFDILLVSVVPVILVFLSMFRAGLRIAPKLKVFRGRIQVSQGKTTNDFYWRELERVTFAERTMRDTAGESETTYQKCILRVTRKDAEATSEFSWRKDHAETFVTDFVAARCADHHNRSQGSADHVSMNVVKC